MFILLSHLLGFIGLSAAAIYDLKTTEVPDYISLFVIGQGLLFHALAAFQQGSITPLVWSLGVGTLFGLYGWGMYYFGMWGGADAFVVTALGFAAPFGLSTTPSILYPVNLFVNLMLVGFVYTIGFSVYKAIQSNHMGKKTFRLLALQRKRVTVELAAAAIVSLFISVYTSLNGGVYFGLMIGLIVLFRFLKALESSEMKKMVPVSDLRPGDVVETSEIEMEHVRTLNLIGSILSRLEKKTGSEKIANLRKKYGYSEIVGITAEEIQKLQDQNVGEVEVKTGVRFVPAFPAALLITDLVGAGVFLVSNLIN